MNSFEKKVFDLQICLHSTCVCVCVCYGQIGQIWQMKWANEGDDEKRKNLSKSRQEENIEQIELRNELQMQFGVDFVRNKYKGRERKYLLLSGGKSLG